jgi:hypothetical protein
MSETRTTGRLSLMIGCAALAALVLLVGLG